MLQWLLSQGLGVCMMPQHDMVPVLAHQQGLIAVKSSLQAVDQQKHVTSNFGGVSCRGRWLLGLLVLQSTSSFVLDSYQELLKVSTFNLECSAAYYYNGVLVICVLL
jgi:hypothetical protein